MALRLSGALADRDSWQTEECSIAKAMDLVGSRPAMLILREAFYGTTRFDDFADRVGITDAVAATRLKQLTEAGVLDKRPYRHAGQRTRYEYVLTQMGEDLLPVLLALMQWADRYLQEDDGPLDVVDDQTGREVVIGAIAGDLGQPLRSDALSVKANRAWVRKHWRGRSRSNES